MVDNVRVPADGAGKRITTNVYNDGANDFHTQVVSIGDRTDPNQQLSVNKEGAALTEFSTGAPIFNSFNHLMTAEDELIASYKFYDGPGAVFGKIEEIEEGTGTVAWDPNTGGHRCRITGGVGNAARIITHRHFSYKPGASVTAYFVVHGNGLEQPNITRRVGLFTDDDGLFFEMVDGQLYCVIRDSRTGTERKVASSAWNGDRLDGSGGDFNRSGVQLNPGKLNIYSITYQYLSAGAVTFGHYVAGRPVTLHTFDNYGVLDAPYMATTYLPLRMEQEATGTFLGEVDMWMQCAAVLYQGYKDIIKTPLSSYHNLTLTDGSEQVVATFRPAQTYNGADNRYVYWLLYGNVITTDQPVLLKVYAKSVVSAAWSKSALGLEYEDSGVTLALYQLLVGPGETRVILPQETGVDATTDGLFRDGNIANSDVWTITATKLGSGGNTDVYATIGWQQIE
jgi:hypothetical protein